jgi:gliding motility-associated-like protein
MKQLLTLALSFLIVNSIWSQSCLTNSLIINTGYNPLTGTSIPPGANGATPVTDPHWIVTSISPDVAGAITVTPIAGLVEVTPGNNADVIVPETYWATNPAGTPGGWISCLNSNTYFDAGNDTAVYNATMSRSFRMCSDDSITISITVTDDDYILTSDIDGAFLYSEPVASLPGFSSFHSFTHTTFLTAGTHTIKFTVSDYSIDYSSENPTGLDIYGTVASATGSNSLVSENTTACLTYVCGATDVCNTVSLPDSLKGCLGNVDTLHGSISGPDSVLSIHWSPAAGLSDTSSLTPMLTIGMSRWYYLTVSSLMPGNLVVNGDFSAGNVSFTSPDYTYAATIPYSNFYTVGTDIYLADPGYPYHFYDHTTPPSGLMLMANGGSPASNTTVWQETVPVTAGNKYIFSAWYAYWTFDLSLTSNPNLYVIINPVGGTGISSSDTFTALTSAFNWNNHSYQWTAPPGATSAILQIRDQNSAYYYNDFCLDDISFQAICTITDSIFISATVEDSSYAHTDTALCTSAAGVTINAPVGFTAVMWSNGATIPSINVASTGTYWVMGIIGCTLNVDTFNVVLKPVPSVILGADSIICIGKSITLGAPERAGAIYLWSTGSTDSAINVNSAGTYSLTVSDSGCTATGDVSIRELSPPIVSLGPDTTLCNGQELLLHTDIDADTYLWSDGTGTPNDVVSQTGTYWVTATNQCGTASDSVSVTFSFCDIWFPSAFTPNNDGLNDIARVRGSFDKFTNFSLSIINRFGQVVFFTQNIFAGWDGTFNGIRQDVGTYYYMIYYTLDGRQSMMKGDLELIR